MQADVFLQTMGQSGLIDLNQGSLNFFVREPHKLMQNMLRAGRLT